MGDRRDDPADRRRPRDPLPLAGHAGRDPGRRLGRLRRLAAHGCVDGRLDRGHHPARRRADPGGAPARGRDRLRDLLPARDARAAGRRRRARRRCPGGHRSVPADRGDRRADRRGRNRCAHGRAARVLPRLRAGDGADRARVARRRDHARAGAHGDPRPARVLAARPLGGEAGRPAEPRRLLRDGAPGGARHRRRRRGRARARGTRTAGDAARRHADRRPAERLAAAPRPGRGRQGLRSGDPLADRRARRERRGCRRARPLRACAGGGAGGRRCDRAVLGDRRAAARTPRHGRR